MPADTHQQPGLLEGAGVTKEVWKGQIEAAMAVWSYAFNTIWPKLTITWVAASNSNGGYEQPNDVATTDVYDLPHEKGIGDFRFGRHPIAGSVAAHTSLPGGPCVLRSRGGMGGDVHFDLETYNWRADTETAGTDLSILLLTVHELGHSFGLTHVDEQPGTPNWKPIMYPSFNATISFGEFTDEYRYGGSVTDHDLNCLKSLYEDGPPAYGTDCNIDHDAGLNQGWTKIVEAIARINDDEESDDENIVITYSFYPGPLIEDTDDPVPAAISLLPNGGPADTTDCCICCGRKLPYSDEAGDKQEWGDSCYDGCCACTSVTSLRFELHECKVIDPQTWQESRGEYVESKPCTKDDGGDYIIDFLMTRKVDECYETQKMANIDGYGIGEVPGEVPSITYKEYLKKYDIDWTTTVDNSNANARQQTCSTNPTANSSAWTANDHNQGTEYVDPDKKDSEHYPEAWGYTGPICRHPEYDGDQEKATTEGERGYSYPGPCKGQEIIASLCCCKTGNYSKGRNAEGGEDPDGSKSACPTEFGEDAEGKNVPPLTPVKDRECSMACFSFTIQPNHIYKHKWKILYKEVSEGVCELKNVNNPLEGTTDACKEDWVLIEEERYTSCSPCVYTQGSCIEGGHAVEKCRKFNPDIMELGSMIPVQDWPNPNSENFGKLNFPPKKNITNWNGQHWIISGQCNDGKTGSKKMSLYVAGAYLTHCDCEQGTLQYPCYTEDDDDLDHVGSLCYEVAGGWMDIYDKVVGPLLCDALVEPPCNGCLEFTNDFPSQEGVTLDVPGMLFDPFPCGRMEKGGNFNPATEEVVPPKGYKSAPHQCHNRGGRFQGDFQWPNDGVKGIQPAEISPAAWNTDGTEEEGYSRVQPFAGNDTWFHGGPNQKGTNTYANDEQQDCEPDVDDPLGNAMCLGGDWEKWGRLYCVGEYEDSNCQSICEKHRPVIMWYTATIEEEASE